MGFLGGGGGTTYVQATPAADTTAKADAAEKKRKENKRALEQSYGQALQTAKRYMPTYSEADSTLSSSSLLNLSGTLGG